MNSTTPPTYGTLFNLVLEVTYLIMLAPVLSRTPSPISKHVSASHFTWTEFFVTWPTIIAPTGGSLFDAFSNIINLKRRKGSIKIWKDLYAQAYHHYFSSYFTVLDSENFWYTDRDV